MYRHTKRAAIWSSLGGLALVLAACGGGGHTESTPQTLAPTGLQDQATLLRASDYLSATAGDERVFGFSRGYGFIDTITAVLPNSGTTRISVDRAQLTADHVEHSVLLLDDQGLWSSNRPASTSADANSEKLLPAQFKEGDTFVQLDSTTTYNTVVVNGATVVSAEQVHIDTTILGREDVSTYAGIFKNCVKTKAIRTESVTSTRNGVTTTSTLPVSTAITWFAPGMGIVKVNHDDGYPDETDSNLWTEELYAYRTGGTPSETTRPTADVDANRSMLFQSSGQFVIRFSEPIRLSTLNNESIQITAPDGQLVPLDSITLPTMTPLSGLTSLTVIPTAAFLPISGDYQVTINDKALDLAGNRLIPMSQSVNLTVTQMTGWCCDSGTKIWLWAH